MKEKFKKLIGDHAGLVFLWVCFLILFLFDAVFDPPASRACIMLLCCVIALPVAAVYLSVLPASYGEPSKMVPTKQPDVSLRVGKIMDNTLSANLYGSSVTGKLAYSMMRDPGYVDTIFVTFENRSGEPIITDTSFLIEKQVGLKWYEMKKAGAYGEAWEPLVIPCGQSGPIPFSLFGRYDYFTRGDYRFIKVLNGPTGAQTVYDVFTVNSKAY